MDALDGLRGFAVLIVILSHTSNSGMFFLPSLNFGGIGKSGVYLFFLLSSFLLAMPLIRKGAAIFSFHVMYNYWQRRFFRIYPLYTLYLLIGLLSTWFFAEILDKHGVGVPFELDMEHFINHITLQEGKGVTWSIAVEFKFYFLLPIIAYIIYVIRSRFGLWASLTLFVILLWLSQEISPQSESTVNDARLLPYMPIFLAGMFLSLVQLEINKKGKYGESIVVGCKYLGYAGVVGIFAMTPLVFSMFGSNVAGNHFHKQFIMYSILWSFVILSAVNSRGVIKSFFELPLLRFYGAISFGIYLFHPVFIGIIRSLSMESHLSAWLVLLVSTVFATISFKLIEAPASKLNINKETLLIWLKIKSPAK